MSAFATCICPTCDEPIRWALDAEGRATAIDANPNPEGALVAVLRNSKGGGHLLVRPFAPGLELLGDGTRRNRWDLHVHAEPLKSPVQVPCFGQRGSP